MSGGALWVGWFAASGLLGLSIAALVLDGAMQVTTGRPGFLPFERLLFKRVPATDADCMRRGAAELLQAVGVTFIAWPQMMLGLIATGNLTGAIAPPASAYPSVVHFALFAAYLASVMFGLVCAIAAYNLSTKVRYVSTGIEARSTST